LIVNIFLSEILKVENTYLPQDGITEVVVGLLCLNFIFKFIIFQTKCIYFTADILVKNSNEDTFIIPDIIDAGEGI
jgi:lipopolysaccharide biosynthesis glycosyltransferase